MKFVLSDDQRDFAGSLDSLLAASDTVAVARAWAAGDTGPGLKLWARLAEQGVTMLATEATPVEVTLAFEALGRYAVPGRGWSPRPTSRWRSATRSRASPPWRCPRTCPTRSTCLLYTSDAADE